MFSEFTVFPATAVIHLPGWMPLWRFTGPYPFEMLFPTQEQVAALASVPERLQASGVATAVPSFHSLAAVQDKVSASRTLARLGIPQPPSSIDTHYWTAFPAFVKEPIGTASNGVRRVDSADDLDRGALCGGQLIQEAVDGPLAMCQSVFEHGSLVVFTRPCAPGKEPAAAPATKRASTCQRPSTGSRYSELISTGTADCRPM